MDKPAENNERPDNGGQEAPSRLSAFFASLRGLAEKIGGNKTVTDADISELKGQVGSISADTLPTDAGLTPEEKQKNREIWQAIERATPDTFTTIDFAHLTYLDAKTARALVSLINRLFSESHEDFYALQQHFDLSALRVLDPETGVILSEIERMGISLKGITSLTPGVRALLNAIHANGVEFGVDITNMNIDDEAARFLLGHTENIFLNNAAFTEVTPATIELSLACTGKLPEQHIPEITREIAESILRGSEELNTTWFFLSQSVLNDPKAAQVLSRVPHKISLPCPEDPAIASALVSSPSVSPSNSLHLTVTHALTPQVASALAGGAREQLEIDGVKELSPEVAKALTSGPLKYVYLPSVQEKSVTDEVRSIVESGACVVSIKGAVRLSPAQPS